MASKYFTAADVAVPDKGPATHWAYIGDGEWWAVGQNGHMLEPMVGKRALTFLPIDQLPRDGLISYTTDRGTQVTERVERGEVI
jgi:hypothetical protein